MTLVESAAPSVVSTGRVARRWTVAAVAAGVDALLITASTIAAMLGRESIAAFNHGEISSTVSIAGPVTAVGWVWLILLFGGYRAEFIGTGVEEFKRVARASFVAAALLGICCYLAKFDLSRGFFFLLFGIGVPALMAGRWTTRAAVRRARHEGAFGQRVVISGSPDNVDEVARVLGRDPHLGYQVIGALTTSGLAGDETATGVPVLGSVEQLELALAHDVDVVFFAGGAHTGSQQTREALWQLEKHAVQVVMAPNMSDVSNQRIRLRPVGGMPFVHVDMPTWANAARLGKRSFDVAGSLLILMLAGPVMIGSAVWIKLHDRGPVLFRHPRVGRGGVAFDCFKFRSMVVDADDQIAALREASGQQPLLFKLKQDPRITRPGRLMRRLSIDELPQLLNVLAGHMSLVGPRPQVAAEVSMYDDAMRRRLHVRPGLTGLWQVSGRSDLSAEEAIRLDLYYVDNWSMFQDLNILGRTLGAVLSARGAY